MEMLAPEEKEEGPLVAASGMLHLDSIVEDGRLVALLVVDDDVVPTKAGGGYEIK